MILVEIGRIIGLRDLTVYDSTTHLTGDAYIFTFRQEFAVDL